MHRYKNAREWEHVFEDPWTELEQSNAFVIGCGPCYDNGMWIARDKIELKVHVKFSYRTYTLVILDFYTGPTPPVDTSKASVRPA